MKTAQEVFVNQSLTQLLTLKNLDLITVGYYFKHFQLQNRLTVLYVQLDGFICRVHCIFAILVILVRLLCF